LSPAQAGIALALTGVWMTRPRQDSGFTLLETMFVIGIIGVIAAIAVPMTGHQLSYLRLSGDARNISNALLLTKMRAAATFTQTRLYVDLGAKSFRIESWRRSPLPAEWVADGGTTSLSGSDRFDFGSVSAPPPYSQVTIGQAPGCYTSASALIANTACIVFNSRGVPIAATGAPTGTESPIATNAVYLTDSTAVYGATVSATGMIRLWRTNPIGTPNWTLQ
jgi:prepilin-type N-terminal cleavage/methylation domain-containing protein